MNRIKNLFLAGLFTLLPIIITIWIIKTVFIFFDNASRNIIANLLGFYIPGSGFLITIGIIFAVGLFTSNILGKKLVAFFDHLISRIPLINIIYKAVKDISKTLSKKSEEGFSKVVRIEFPRSGIYSVGFVTNNAVQSDQGNKVAVFIPTTPNPTNGFLVYMDEADVEELDIPVEEGVKMIMSMGSVGDNMYTKK